MRSPAKGGDGGELGNLSPERKPFSRAGMQVPKRNLENCCLVFRASLSFENVNLKASLPGYVVFLQLCLNAGSKPREATMAEFFQGASV